MLNWKLLGGVLVSAAAVSATLALVNDGPTPPSGAAEAPAPRPAGGVTRAPSGASVELLMELLDREVEERLVLQEQVDALEERLANLEGSAGPEARSPDRNPAESRGIVDPDGPRELTESALLAAGFSASEAEYYRRRYDEVAMAQLYLRDQAEREGWLRTPRYYQALRDARQGLDSLRAEMDDDSYSRFLYALGQPNQVTIRRVLTGSAAEAAGLEPGDVVLRYDGARVYAVPDLRRSVRSGESGDTVAVDILRGGNRIQTYLPRGPLGISMSSDSVPVSDDS